MKTSRADRFLKSLKNGKIYSYNVLLDEWTIMFGTVIGFLNFIKQHSKYNLIQCSGLETSSRYMNYKVNKKKKTNKQTSIDVLAKSILKITLEETKKRLDIWIDKNLNDKLSTFIANEIEKEFSEHVLPVLLKKIDIHVKDIMTLNKNQVKKIMLEITKDFVASQEKG